MRESSDKLRLFVETKRRKGRRVKKVFKQNDEKV